jgi:hypothetical protein
VKFALSCQKITELLLKESAKNKLRILKVSFAFLLRLPAGKGRFLKSSLCPA